MQPEKNSHFDFFKRDKGANAVPEELSSSKKQTVIKKSSFISDKNMRFLLCILAASVGLVGMHFNVEYSGWLIALGIFMAL